MAPLSFALGDLKPIIDHAAAAKSHAVTLGHCFDKASDVDPDWWDTVRDKCSGDDFSEPVSLCMVQAALSQKPNAKRA